MTSYRIALSTFDGGTRSSCMMEFSSEDEACDHGSELLLRSELDVLEVWRGSRMVFRVVKVNGKGQTGGTRQSGQTGRAPKGSGSGPAP